MYVYYLYCFFFFDDDVMNEYQRKYARKSELRNTQTIAWELNFALCPTDPNGANVPESPE